MTEASDSYATVASGFTARLSTVPKDTWSATSPCSEWTTRDLVAHVVDTNRRVLANATGEPAQAVAPDENLIQAWLVASKAVADGLADPEIASRVSGGMFGEQSFESLVSRLLCADTLLHTWDLARSTGQDEKLDPEAVANAQTFLEGIDGAIRRPGGFGPKIEPAEGPDPQTKLLNFCGRSTS